MKTNIDDFVTTQQIADEYGYPAWAVRRGADALGVAQRLKLVRAIRRDDVPRILEWLTSRNITRTGEKSKHGDVLAIRTA